MTKKNKKTVKAGQKIPVTVKKGTVDVLGRLDMLGKNQLHAVLATVSGDEPYTSLIAYALTPDMKVLLFATPRKTRKYRNIVKNKNVCLLIDTRADTAGDYMKAESISVIGTAHAIRKGSMRDELAKVLIKKHPELKGFIAAPSTALIFVEIKRCIHVGSFQAVSEYP